MRLALAQIAPRLGDVDANLELHLDYIERARAGAAALVCFPELSLTGYTLRDLAPAVALRPVESDPVFAQLLAASRDIDIVVGFTEETPRYLYHNSAAYLSAGQVIHVHRKVYLPTYGMFEEGRFMAPGDGVRSFATRFGGAAILICEDMWHLALSYLAWLDGADYLIGVTGAPARGLPPTLEHPASTEAWSTLARALAQFLTSYVILCNRAGCEDGATFGGASQVLGPSGMTVARGPDLEPALVLAELDASHLRRNRIAYPMLRDERPDLVLRELQRILAGRA
jgi:predicted amidohydrolase